MVRTGIDHDGLDRNWSRQKHGHWTCHAAGWDKGNDSRSAKGDGSQGQAATIRIRRHDGLERADTFHDRKGALSDLVELAQTESQTVRRPTVMPDKRQPDSSAN
jgi:hypothetical protein